MREKLARFRLIPPVFRTSPEAAAGLLFLATLEEEEEEEEGHWCETETSISWVKR